LWKYLDMAFPRYLAAGVLNTVLTYLLYLGLLLLMPYIWAYSLTYIAGIASGYTLNAKWVFKKAPNIRSAMAYPLSYAVNYILGISLLWVLVEIVDIPSEVAPLVVIVISVPLMYILTKFIFQGGLSHGDKIDNQ